MCLFMFWTIVVLLYKQIFGIVQSTVEHIYMIEIERAGECAGPICFSGSPHSGLLRIADVKRVLWVARFAKAEVK